MRKGAQGKGEEDAGRGACAREEGVGDGGGLAVAGKGPHGRQAGAWGDNEKMLMAAHLATKGVGSLSVSNLCSTSVAKLLI